MSFQDDSDMSNTFLSDSDNNDQKFKKKRKPMHFSSDDDDIDELDDEANESNSKLLKLDIALKKKIKLLEERITKKK